ncbi:hypothetical protein Clacol_005889 [Clathrus columnatus]|uniref:7alpha-cephem-methoxylase P8 chain n=1 Tax=Clathrus columnatus TaxID=1419009 RepID=A0AAV5AG58_9AGAM|nr:hypothetical protein Clacol_005889 [Clathrus columnatus]
MAADTVNTTLYYFQPPFDNSKPWFEVDIDPKTGQRNSNFTLDSQVLEVENVRGHEDEYDLDSSGFRFLKWSSDFTSFNDDAAIKSAYYKESAEIIKKVTGCRRVVLFDHSTWTSNFSRRVHTNLPQAIRRNRPGVPDISEDTRAPVPRVHVDQTPEAAARRVHMHTPENIASDLLKHRFQIINFWRPINHSALDYPLALCDYRTIDWDNDLIPTTIKFANRVGENFSVKYSPQHRWKYLRGMRTDELVLIKCFDSRMDGKTAILTPHTAFIDPTTPKDAPLRESIELRALVFYDDLSAEIPVSG